jgi:hypothetical protein
MSSVNAKFSQALFPLLAVTLLATACSDSTAPTPVQGSAGNSTVQSPADSNRSPGSQDLGPDHVATEPPVLPDLGTDDKTTSSIKPSFYTKSAAYGSGYAPGPGAMNVSPGAVGCLGGFISVGGVTVSQTNGLSKAYGQYVVGEAFLYRLVGTTWVYQSMRRADAALPWVAPIAFLKQNDPLLASVRGTYTVVLRLTWYAWIGGVWVQTAGINVNFVHASDYTGVLGAIAGPGGYCRVS